MDAIRWSNYNPTKQEDVSTVSRLLSNMVSRGSEKKIKEEALDRLASAELTPQNSFTETKSHPQSPSGSNTALQHYNTKFETKFSFLIDGLDEFDGDHQSLMSMLVDINRSYNIKILAASRPWLLIQDEDL
ncbi:hypothetical protein EMCG_01701 [[Emmonsia] crescens]|uniref:Nephrocystin 3-like N-terminal domain-containing protein n=1 Tax=[Emmonsia] crescens TaxID=73230 RepID=A0A0G2I1M1_9EURO|nr:hypothetical protein EMCG_01701 [Emmonsia crescens UAMH 3008]